MVDDVAVCQARVDDLDGVLRLYGELADNHVHAIPALRPEAVGTTDLLIIPNLTHRGARGPSSRMSSSPLPPDESAADSC
jgi:hypothetical protein